MMISLTRQMFAVGIVASVAQIPAGTGTDSLLQAGAIGVISVAFLTFVYGLAKNQIVSRDAAEIERRLMEMSAQLIKLLEEQIEREERMQQTAAEREKRLAAIADRQMIWLEGWRSSGKQ